MGQSKEPDQPEKSSPKSIDGQDADQTSQQQEQKPSSAAGTSFSLDASQARLLDRKSQTEEAVKHQCVVGGNDHGSSAPLSAASHQEQTSNLGLLATNTNIAMPPPAPVVPLQAGAGIPAAGINEALAAVGRLTQILSGGNGQSSGTTSSSSSPPNGSDGIPAQPATQVHRDSGQQVVWNILQNAILREMQGLGHHVLPTITPTSPGPAQHPVTPVDIAPAPHPPAPSSSKVATNPLLPRPDCSPSSLMSTGAGAPPSGLLDSSKVTGIALTMLQNAIHQQLKVALASSHRQTQQQQQPQQQSLLEGGAQPVHHHQQLTPSIVLPAPLPQLPTPTSEQVQAACRPAALFQLLQLTTSIQQMVIRELSQQGVPPGGLELNGTIPIAPFPFSTVAASSTTSITAPPSIVVANARTTQLAHNKATSTTETNASVSSRRQNPKRSEPNGVTSALSSKRAKKAATIPDVTGKAPILLAVEGDSNHLSPYQCLLRQQIELFETPREAAGRSTQGRVAPLLPGQVGLRCRHCANAIPQASARPRGSMLFTKNFAGVYQIAQNICKNHFLVGCPSIPPETRETLKQLRQKLNRGAGGKQFWTEALHTAGVVEAEDCLRFAV